MNRSKTKSITQKLLLYMGERKLKELTDLFDEKVDWDIPGNSEKIPWLGVRNKKGEIKEFFLMLWNNTVPISANVHKIMCEDTQAIIIGEFESRMKVTNKLVCSFFCIHLETENNLIKKYRLFENSYAVHRAMKM